MGLEYISQPQIFLSPITAVGGVQNGLFDSPVPPLFTSFYTWTSTSSITATTFPLTGIETLTDRPGSFIVTVGGVLQSPETYIIDNIGRTITFNNVVNEDTVVLITQIGTIATSALDISLLTATNSFFENIVGNNSIISKSSLVDVTATNIQILASQFFGTTVFDTVTATNLVVLSSVTQVQETIITPTSGVSLTAIGESLFQGLISATDSVVIDQDLTVSGTIYNQSLTDSSNIWNNNTTLLQDGSANWNTTYETVCSLSGNWESVYNVVQTLSTDWEESAEILPTVTNYLSTELVTVSSLNVTEQLLSGGTDVLNVFTTYLSTGSITVSSLNVTEQLLSAGSDLFEIFLTQETDSQTLTYTESSYELEISNGNIVNLSSVNTVFAANSANWETTYYIVCSLSATWEESVDILPTVTNYLSTDLVTISSLNVTQQILSGNADLLDVFLTPNNTLTTSICAMSGDGITPFVMQFTNGLLTSLTV